MGVTDGELETLCEDIVGFFEALFAVDRGQQAEWIRKLSSGWDEPLQKAGAVRPATFDLGDRKSLLKLSKTVTIRVNGEERYRQLPRPSVKIMLENRFFQDSGDNGLFTFCVPSAVSWRARAMVGDSWRLCTAETAQVEPTRIDEREPFHDFRNQEFGSSPARSDVTG